MTSEIQPSSAEGKDSSLYGILAQFADTQTLICASESLVSRGYRRLDAYTPFAVSGLAEAIGFRRTRMPLVVLIGGLVGLASGYGLQWWVSAVAYPLNIGGRPLNSWPAFIPVTFELTILFAALSAVLGMLALNGLPRPHHPLFEIPAFERASTDGFFLCVESRDPHFHAGDVRRVFSELHASEIWDVPQSP